MAKSKKETTKKAKPKKVELKMTNGSTIIAKSDKTDPFKSAGDFKDPNANQETQAQ